MSSYPMMLRDKLATKVQALAFFTGHGFTFSTNRALQIQPQSVPFCGIYLIETVGLPDGDANVGEIRFRTTARYGISVIVQNNDEAAAELKLDEALLAIETLFTDPTFYNWEKAGQANEVAVQSFNRNSRTHQFGSIGKDNEMPIAELRYDLTCDLGVIYYDPVVADTFGTLHVTTQFPLGGTQQEIDETQQVVAQYEVPQN